MLYKEIGNTGINASILGFGCMRFPVVDGNYGNIDKDKTFEMIDAALKGGVNYFDTAYTYHGGQSEVVLGEALQYKRENVIITTKILPHSLSSRDDLERILDEQLKRLRTDHVDFHFVHSLQQGAWDKAKGLGVREFLDDALADGRIKHAGFSFHDAAPVFINILNDYDKWELAQVQHNFLEVDYQAGRAGIAEAAKRGIGVSIMEPLRGGDLVRPIPALKAVWDKNPIKRSPVAWAFRFLWGNPDISLVLSGMSTLDQVLENIEAASDPTITEPFSEAEIQTFKEAREFLLSRTKVPCTKCQYCMPCPHGVNIPFCFDKYNLASIFENLQAQKAHYNSISAKGAGASACKNCGKCVKACPQHIDIPARLKEVAKLFES